MPANGYTHQRPDKYIPVCPCCKWRQRKWVPAGARTGYYLDYCGDCLAAAEALAGRRPIPPIRFGNAGAGTAT